MTFPAFFKSHTKYKHISKHQLEDNASVCRCTRTHTHAQKSHGEKIKHTGSIAFDLTLLSHFKKKKVGRKVKL